MVPPEKMTESPSEWTLSGIADAVISHQTGKLHERQMKKPSGDETPDTSGATGIGDVDRIAGKKRNTGFIATQFKVTPKGEVVKGKEAMHLDDHDLGESTNELQLEGTGNATMELIGGFDDIELEDDKPSPPPRKPLPPKDQGKGGKKK
ncbi:MAG: hypothetical protein L6Q71_07115 [Planctomycetes bacterium]|nr:hypothetical protein [Planctomycetota bacterium]